MVTDVKEGQPEKALLPISMTLLGMIADVKAEQPLKALSAITMTFSPMVADAKEEQPLFWSISYVLQRY